MNEQQRRRAAGFSLIELLVAMTITLIVSGAIYGLLTAGQSAFRREPELTERQQNIRLAMDLIMHDVSAAGAGLPPFVQVFTSALDAPGGSPTAPSGVQSDELEVLASTGTDSMTTCAPVWSGTGSTVALTRGSLSTPIGVGRLAFLIFSTDNATAADDRWTTRRLTAEGVAAYTATPTGPIPPDCTASSNHWTLTFASGDPTGTNPGSLCLPALRAPVGNVGPPCTSERLARVAFGNQVRYRIRTDAGVPVLERRSTESATAAAPTGTFQMVATGIEELQVQYTTVAAPTTWVNSAPVVSAPGPAPDYGSLINQIRVTMSSRAEATHIAGAVAAPGDPVPRLRGSMTSTTTPRAVLLHLARGRPSPGPSPTTWYWE